MAAQKNAHPLGRQAYKHRCGTQVESETIWEGWLTFSRMRDQTLTLASVERLEACYYSLKFFYDSNYHKNFHGNLDGWWDDGMFYGITLRLASGTLYWIEVELEDAEEGSVFRLSDHFYRIVGSQRDANGIIGLALSMAGWQANNNWGWELLLKTKSIDIFEGRVPLLHDWISRQDSMKMTCIDFAELFWKPELCGKLYTVADLRGFDPEGVRTMEGMLKAKSFAKYGKGLSIFDVVETWRRGKEVSAFYSYLRARARQRLKTQAWRRKKCLPPSL